MREVIWLPTPIYERIPHFYFLAGLLFMTDGLYLGFENAFSFFLHRIRCFVLRLRGGNTRHAHKILTGATDR